MLEQSTSRPGWGNATFDEGVLWQMVPLGICVIDRHFIVHGWNRQLESWTKLSFETARGKSLSELFPGFQIQRFSDRILQVFDTAVPTVLSSALHRYFLPITPTGSASEPWMVQETRILRLPGEPSRVVISMADMTTVVRQQEKLRRDRAALIQTRQALESANDSLQSSLEQLANINRKLQDEVLERKQIEVELRRQTNEIIAAKARETEHRARLEQFIRDLTVARQQAESAARVKSEFLANMSHEIRTPMTAILGYVDMLEDPELSAEQRNQAKNAIRRNGAHLLDVINDILDISKIEAGKLAVELIPVAIRDVVSDVIDMMRSRATDRDLELRTRISNRVPVEVHTDPLRMRQILINLLGNAIKFTSSGEVVVNVDWQFETTGVGTLTVAVSDTGIGMTPETRDKLFQPFVQADTQLTRNFGGTGLGLAISQRLANLLNGQIRVESQLGLGSTFIVTFRCDRFSMFGARTPETATSQMVTAQASQKLSLAGFRILVVDDAPDNRKLLSFHLKKAGAELQLAENGLEALGAIFNSSGNPFDLILMDMQMPILDGYEATRRLRAAGDTTPIIAVTAHAMADDRSKCLKAGCNDYLAKPIQRELLISTSTKWCRNSVTHSLH